MLFVCWLFDLFLLAYNYNYYICNYRKSQNFLEDANQVTKGKAGTKETQHLMTIFCQLIRRFDNRVCVVNP